VPATRPAGCVPPRPEVARAPPRQFLTVQGLKGRFQNGIASRAPILDRTGDQDVRRDPTLLQPHTARGDVVGPAERQPPAIGQHRILRDEHRSRRVLAHHQGAPGLLQGGGGQFGGATAGAIDQNGHIVRGRLVEVAAARHDRQRHRASIARHARRPGLASRQEAGQRRVRLEQKPAGIAPQIDDHIGFRRHDGKLFAQPAAKPSLEAVHPQHHGAGPGGVDREGRQGVHLPRNQGDRPRLSRFIPEGQQRRPPRLDVEIDAPGLTVDAL
jgi:hypothetical protein